MKREFSPKQIMQMILVCFLLVAVVYIFYRADHAELSQLNGPVTASQGAAALENESDPALRSFTYLLDKGESTEYYLNYEDNPVMRYIANYQNRSLLSMKSLESIWPPRLFLFPDSRIR